MYHDEWSRQLLSTPLLPAKHKSNSDSLRRWPYPFVTGDLFRMVATWIFDETGYAERVSVNHDFLVLFLKKSS
jgi:hypothetical protein